MQEVGYTPEMVERGLRDLVAYETSTVPVALEVVYTGGAYEVRLTLEKASIRAPVKFEKQLKAFMPEGFRLRLIWVEDSE